MSHLDAAQLHEYLDRGAVDENMKAVGEHVVECDVCTRLLHAVEAERTEASTILRAAVPIQRPMPLFETLVPRPKYETFDGGVPSDISFPSGAGQFKQSSIGVRGQAVMFAWAATVVLALGAGWFANVIYRANAARDGAVIASRGGPPNATAPAIIPADSLSKGNVLATSDSSHPSVASRGAASTPSGPTGAPANRIADAPRIAASPGAQGATSAIASGNVNAPPADLSRSVEQAKVTGDRSPIVPRDQVLAGSAATDGFAYPETWNNVSADSAATIMGGEIVAVRGVTILEYAVGRVAGGVTRGFRETRVRVRQLTTSRDTIEVVQYVGAPKPVALGASSRTNAQAAAPKAAAAKTAASEPTAMTVTGAFNGRFYQTAPWENDRVVTVIGIDAKSVRDAKLYAFDPRKSRNIP